MFDQKKIERMLLLKFQDKSGIMSALVSLSESTEFQQESNTYKQFLLKDLSEELIKS